MRRRKAFAPNTLVCARLRGGQPLMPQQRTRCTHGERRRPELSAAVTGTMSAFEPSGFNALGLKALASIQG